MSASRARSANAPRAGRLKRPRQAMPDFVREALGAERLEKAYATRPAYQRNDYLWWIKDAKREETRQKRLHQMLDELRGGDRYMNMPWRGEQAKDG